MTRQQYFIRLLGWVLALSLLVASVVLLVTTVPRPDPTLAPNATSTPTPAGRSPSASVVAPSPASVPTALECAQSLTVSVDQQTLVAPVDGPAIVTTTNANRSDLTFAAAELHIMTAAPVAVTSADPLDATLRPFVRTRLKDSDELIFTVSALPPNGKAALRLALSVGPEQPTIAGLTALAVVNGLVCDEVVLAVPSTPVSPPPLAETTTPQLAEATADPVPVSIGPYPAPNVGSPTDKVPTATSHTSSSTPGSSNVAFTVTQTIDQMEVREGDKVEITLTFTMHGQADVTVYLDNVLPPCLALADLIVSRRDATYIVEHARQRIGVRVDGMRDGETVTVQLVTRAAKADTDSCVNTAQLAALAGPEQWNATANPVSVTVRPSQ